MYEKLNLSSSIGAAILSVAGALIFALLFFGVATLQSTRYDSAERDQMVTLIDSFVSAYSKTRSQENFVPAVFRRLAVEHFSENLTGEYEATPTTIRVTGTPGLEMRSIETDGRIRQIIRDYVDGTRTEPVTENRFENHKLTGRSIYPSIATEASCVDCHNDLLGDGTYQLNDVMGVVVIESELSLVLLRNAGFSGLVFFVVLAALLYYLSRERKRVGQVVAGLKAEVHLEQVKADAAKHEEFLRSHDPLTGLANRSTFQEHLAEVLGTIPTPNVMLALVDMQDFKPINDRLGHAAGDALLHEIASRLVARFDPCGAFVATLGGDEFAIVVENNADIPDAETLGSMVLQAIEPHFEYETTILTPQASVGLAEIQTLDDAGPMELLKAADAALNTAEVQGKHVYRIFDEDIRACLWRQAHITSRLANAIKNQEIRAVLQPKIDLRTGSLIGFEALARWRCDDEELSPGEFIPIAENAGLAHDLDLAVLRKAAEFSVACQRETGQLVSFSANLSALNFRSDGLAENILDILWETGLDPAHLTLELVESVAVSNWQRVRSNLQVLREKGVRISLDDFGTGFSSLSYLRQFKFEEIKIDRAFIIDIAENTETRFLFKSIVDLAAGLGSTIVAEGLETIEQINIVRECGAEIGQGFYYSKPLEVVDAHAFVIDASRKTA